MEQWEREYLDIIKEKQKKPNKQKKMKLLQNISVSIGEE